MTLFFPYSIILFSLSVQIEGDLCDRNAIAVFFRSQFNPIVFPGKDLAEGCPPEKCEVSALSAA
jgi:hypothetical protein